MKTKLLLIIFLFVATPIVFSQTNFITTWETTVANETITHFPFS